MIAVTVTCADTSCLNARPCLRLSISAMGAPCESLQCASAKAQTHHHIFVHRLQCVWHASDRLDLKSSCDRPKKVTGMIGSGSCHPFTPIANRETGYVPSQHDDYDGIFGETDSLCSTIDTDDPDFWISENVEGFLVPPQDGSPRPIDILMDRTHELVDRTTGTKRFHSTWKRMDQADHFKAKRRRHRASATRIRH